MKLYEFPPTRSIRVRWVLQALEIEFESVVVDLTRGDHQRPEFLAINAAGRVPVLVLDDGTALTESVAIALYLADKHSEKGLMPRTPEERAEVYRWSLFAATEIEQPLWRISRHTALYPEAKRLPAEVELAKADLAPMAAVLDRHLAGRSFVAGRDVSVADFIVAYTLDWAGEAGLLGPFEFARTYVERMYQRADAPPRIRAALENVVR
jgi:glutathione S-transferase